MTVNSVRGSGAGNNAPQDAGADKKPPKIKDQAEFEQLLKKMDEDKAAGGEPDKEDMQRVLSYSIRQSVLASGRQMQQTAKEIERENIDKGF